MRKITKDAMITHWFEEHEVDALNINNNLV